MITTRRARRALALATLACAGIATAGCTGTEAASPSTTVASSTPPASADVFVDWTGKVGEIVVACNDGTVTTDGILDGHSSTAPDGDDTNLDAATASGQAYEHCAYALDGDADLTDRAELDASWAAGTAAVADWLTATAQAHRSAALVALGNIDDRHLVAELTENQRQADESAARLDEMFTTTAASFGLDAPDGLGLHRWAPPEH